MNEQIIGIILLTLFVFILIREIICWYFKASEITKLLSDIKKELVKSNNSNS